MDKSQLELPQRSIHDHAGVCACPSQLLSEWHGRTSDDQTRHVVNDVMTLPSVLCHAGLSGRELRDAVHRVCQPSRHKSRHHSQHTQVWGSCDYGFGTYSVHTRMCPLVCQNPVTAYNESLHSRNPSSQQALEPLELSDSLETSVC